MCGNHLSYNHAINSLERGNKVVEYKQTIEGQVVEKCIDSILYRSGGGSIEPGTCGSKYQRIVEDIYGEAKCVCAAAG